MDHRHTAGTWPTRLLSRGRHTGVTGRGADRKVCIQVGSGCYDFGAGESGGLSIKDLPAASPLPAAFAK